MTRDDRRAVRATRLDQLAPHNRTSASSAACLCSHIVKLSQLCSGAIGMVPPEPATSTNRPGAPSVAKYYALVSGCSGLSRPSERFITALPTAVSVTHFAASR
jgi:hypothetical protein